MKSTAFLEISTTAPVVAGLASGVQWSALLRLSALICGRLVKHGGIYGPAVDRRDFDNQHLGAGQAPNTAKLKAAAQKVTSKHREFCGRSGS
jgi:hypothetical protein